MTRHAESSPYVAGRDYAIQPGRTDPTLRGVRLRVKATRIERLDAITEVDARLEGFASVAGLHGLLPQDQPEGGRRDAVKVTT